MVVGRCSWVGAAARERGCARPAGGGGWASVVLDHVLLGPSPVFVSPNHHRTLTLPGPSFLSRKCCVADQPHRRAHGSEPACAVRQPCLDAVTTPPPRAAVSRCAAGRQQRSQPELSRCKPCRKRAGDAGWRFAGRWGGGKGAGHGRSRGRRMPGVLGWRLKPGRGREMPEQGRITGRTRAPSGAAFRTCVEPMGPGVKKRVPIASTEWRSSVGSGCGAASLCRSACRSSRALRAAVTGSAWGSGACTRRKEVWGRAAVGCRGRQGAGATAAAQGVQRSGHPAAGNAHLTPALPGSQPPGRQPARTKHPARGQLLIVVDDRVGLEVLLALGPAAGLHREAERLPGGVQRAAAAGSSSGQQWVGRREGLQSARAGSSGGGAGAGGRRGGGGGDQGGNAASGSGRSPCLPAPAAHEQVALSFTPLTSATGWTIPR